MFMHRPVHLQCSRKLRSPPQLADIRQLCEVYGEHAMSDSLVRRWVRHFKGRKNVHDDSRSGQLSPVNEDLVHAVEEKIQENKLFTISLLFLHFPQISWPLLHEIVSDKLQGSTINTGATATHLTNCIVRSRTSDMACLVWLL
jgi:hypothetical protein